MDEKRLRFVQLPRGRRVTETDLADFIAAATIEPEDR